MSIAKQLYQLQEIDLAIESAEQALQQIASQLGQDEAVAAVRNRLAAESQHLEELNKQQHSIEWEIDDLTGKLADSERQLYSGKIGNPKELANLQHEVVSLKAQRGRLEDKALEIMDRAELLAQKVATISSELEAAEAEWHSQQQQLSTDRDRLKTMLSELEDKRRQLLARIESRAAELYRQLKEQKRQAVVKVVQGICGGCRISLPSVELQRARGGNLAQCSSCGRILFLD